MRIYHKAALVMALAAMAAPVSIEPAPRPSRPLNRKVYPIETGPVIDSTPESKRAKRRRLAKIVNGGRTDA